MKPPLRSLGHRAPLLWLAVPLMAGIASARAFAYPTAPIALIVAAIAAVASVILASRVPVAWAVSLFVAMFSGGVATLRLHDVHVAAWDDLPPREGSLLVRVDRVFPRQDAVATGVGVIADATGAVAELRRERIYFSLRLRPAEERPVRGAMIRCRGVLAPVPSHPDPGSFDRYLADAGIHVRLSRGRLVAIERPPAAYYLFLERAATRLNRWLDEGIARKRPALEAVFRAMMLGQKHELSSEQNEMFMLSGTMHLFAINGLHIGVVAVALHALLALLRCPRPITVLVTLAVLWFDVDTTGASPSAVRAFLLVACVEVGFLLRKPPNGLASLSTAALLGLLLDPFALFSASFQMSYGVVFAILTFGLPLAQALENAVPPFARLPRVSWAWWHHLFVWALRKGWPAVGIGAAAGVISTITGPTFFQVFAPVGLLSNLVLVPLASLVIVAGFASVVAAALWLGGINVLFNHAALVVLLAIDFGVRRSAALPAGSWAASWRVEWLAPLTLAAVLSTMAFGYAHGWRKERGGWWPPVVVTAFAVVVGVRFGG